MNQKQKKFIASLAMVSLLIAVSGYYPGINNAQAVNALTAASALLTTSAPGVAATTTISFTTATTTDASGYFEVAMPAGQFGSVAGKASCSAGAVSTPDANTVRCTGVTGLGVKTITLANVTNPTATTSQVINVYHYNTAGNLAERVQVMVQIIDTIWMTARVDATLQFTVAGLDSTQTVNGLNCTATTSATSTPFGTLVPNVRSNVCQELKVTTNASQGFTVTVQEDQEMTSDGGDNINSFDNAVNGVGSSTAHLWNIPTGTLDQDQTYGHMGLTSNDTDLASLGSYNDFYNGGTPQFAGLTASVPMPIYHHDGPADGSTGATQDKGKARVLYSAEINPLQQAGDYENILTYIATPTY